MAAMFVPEEVCRSYSCLPLSFGIRNRNSSSRYNRPRLRRRRSCASWSPGPGVDQGALIDQCALDSTSSKRSRQAISVQLALDQPAASAGDQQLEGTSADQLILLQASDAISHQQWLRALLNVVEKQRKSSGEEPPQPQAQVPCQQPQQQQPSPKCKTWKGRVAKQFRRIGQGGGGGGSSPISPTAPPAAASYQEGASIGVPLDWCPQSQTHEGVPLLVEVCCGEVEARGLEVVGVYRVPGNTAAVTALTEQVNRASGGDVIAQLVAQADVNVVSSLLKSLFRRLPDALLTSDLYPLFIAADKIADPLLRAATIRKLVHSLPDHHFETLRFVMAHLQRVVGRCKVNKMEPRNLAIVFGPTLVRPTADDSCSMLTLVTDMSHQCRIVETLILHADWCFSDDDIDRLQLTTSGGGSEATPPLPPSTSEHMSDNHSLLLENIHKVQGMKSGDLSGSGSGTNLVSAKDIVVSIIGAANRKMHKSKLSRGTGSKQSQSSVAATAQSREDDGSRGVAASIRESVLFSGSILAASSHRSHGKKSNDGVDGGGGGEERSRSQDQDQDEEDEASLTAAVVDKDGMIRTYTGLSACKQERIRRFEQETKAMLQRENAARLSGGGVGLGLEERSKRELDYTDAAGTAESPPSGEDLLSSLTSTFDAKLRSLLSSTEAAAALMTSGDVTSSQVVTSSEEGGEPVAAAFRDPSLHRSTSTTSAASSSCSGQFYQLNRANSNTAACESTLKQQDSVNEAEEEQSVLVENKKKKKKREEGTEEEEEEGEEKKDDSLATKDPLSCKEEEEEEELTKKDVEPIASLKTAAAAEATKTPASEAAAAAVCKVRRSESLEKRALKNADDLLTAGDCKISRRSSLKRSDSLTKSEKTESNLYRRRQQASQQASKRKNGLGGDAVSSGGAGKCAIKRRHTVGGTKDFGGGSDATYNRRTSSPDLSRAARACWEGAAAPFTPPTAPLESHV
ncbi:hypothetical protein LSTR_LSTR012607 [Laodelphax striatellus]|uniref:Rho-GAP domain-containing protein n=1 Tax=Laodelphax striatellus TaxID=195883 RepID=A0A482XQ66_LAOST|nr:hypothetical protein LSTR_LSTR012607 [Laodelphax striatellus]